MMVTKIKSPQLTKPAGIGIDDTTSRRVSGEVAENMDNNPGGMTQIETGPGDTLESIAKGHLQGSGQKVDLGNMLFEQSKIISENRDEIAKNSRDGTKPDDFRTFKGRELPQGIKINLSTSHTPNSITPANPQDRNQSQSTSGKNKDQESADSLGYLDPLGAQSLCNDDNFYAGAGSISETRYALEYQNVGLSDEAKKGMAKYLQPMFG